MLTGTTVPHHLPTRVVPDSDGLVEAALIGIGVAAAVVLIAAVLLYAGLGAYLRSRTGSTGSRTGRTPGRRRRRPSPRGGRAP